MYYDCIFLVSEMKEIVLYGMDGNDFFQFSGEGKFNIKICVVGGLGKDEFMDIFKKSGCFFIYDLDDEKIILDVNLDVRIKISNNLIFNIYDCLLVDYNFNFGSLFLNFGFNLDDGIFLGILGMNMSYGFKKQFYFVCYIYYVNFVVVIGGVDIVYFGEFINVFGGWEFLFDVRFKILLYVINFYGLGNDMENFEEEEGNNFN